MYFILNFSHKPGQKTSYATFHHMENHLFRTHAARHPTINSTKNDSNSLIPLCEYASFMPFRLNKPSQNSRIFTASDFSDLHRWKRFIQIRLYSDASLE